MGRSVTTTEIKLTPKQNSFCYWERCRISRICIESRVYSDSCSITSVLERTAGACCLTIHSKDEETEFRVWNWLASGPECWPRKSHAEAEWSIQAKRDSVTVSRPCIPVGEAPAELWPSPHVSVLVKAEAGIWVTLTVLHRRSPMLFFSVLLKCTLSCVNLISLLLRGASQRTTDRCLG